MIWISAHWLWTPPTFGILLVVWLLLVVRALLRGAQHASPAAPGVCPHEDCRHQNPPQARYCAQCGRELPRS